MSRLFIILAGFFLIIAGCGPAKYENSPKQRLANEIRAKAMSSIRKEYGLSPFGTGGQMMYEVVMLAISFKHYGTLSVDEGRVLLEACVAKLVDEVNRNEEIRPYLKNYPFGPENVEVRIFVNNRDGTSVKDGDLCVLTAMRGLLEYESHKPGAHGYITVHEETYEEALQIVQAERAKSA